MHRSNDDGNVFCSKNDFIVDVTFYSCNFINCGNIINRPILGIFNDQSKLNISHCFFSFDNSSTSSQILFSNSENVCIYNCTFNKCGTIKIQNNNSKDEGKFVFINNNINFNTQTLINLKKLRTKQVIKNNKIQNCYMNTSTYLFSIHFLLDEIEFINNIFSNGKQNGGSFAGLFQNNGDHEITLIYTNCTFINNENIGTENPFNCGGAIQYGHSSITVNTSLVFKDCLFNGNKCMNGKGGALAIGINQNLNISNCIFKNNYAAKGSVIYFFGHIYDYANIKSIINESQVDSISITECKFIDNKCDGDVSGILIEEDLIKVKTVVISSCNFLNNGNYELQTLIQSTCDDVIFENNIIEYKDTDKKCGGLKLTFRKDLILYDSIFTKCKFDGSSSIQLFGNSDSSVSISNCDFVDCRANTYSVSILNGEVFINKCKFIFTNIENSCSGINIDSPKSVFIEYCLFEKNNNQNKGESGCLYINKQFGTISSLNIANLFFNSCKGTTYNTIYVNCKCESLATIKNLTINNTQNTQENVYIFGFNANQDLSFEQCTFMNCKSSNVQGGGIGSRLIPLNKISFSECSFINNFCSKNGGSFEYGNDPQLKYIVIEFQNCNFTNNKSKQSGGALFLCTYTNVLIDDCLFIKNIAGITERSNLLSSEEKNFGGAIFINPKLRSPLLEQPVYTISKSRFIENEAKDGNAICIDNSDNTLVDISQQNIFTDNGKTGITILTDQSNYLGDSIFNTSKNSHSNPIEYKSTPAYYYDLTFHEPITIDEDQKECQIRNCIFDNCNFPINQGHQYLIYIHCETFIFDSNVIQFDNAQIACGGILIDCYGNVTITNSYFKSCNVNDETQTAGVLYEPQNGDSSIENFIFKNNVFEDIEGINSRCFKIKVFYRSIIEQIDNITIKYCPEGGNIGSLYIINDISITITLDDWKFIMNESNALFGGGCSLLVSCSPQINNNHFIFTNCVWDQNEAIYDSNVGIPGIDYHNGAGGAFQFGFDESNVETQLTFSFCLFLYNIADEEGGALAIQTTKNCYIDNCKFEGNIARKSGGAIFIDPDFNNEHVTSDRNPLIELTSCEFTSNDAYEDGSALLITGSKASYSISSVSFLENRGRLNVFYSSADSLDFSNISFKSSKDYRNRALELSSEGAITIKSISFIDFTSDFDGSMIKLSSQSNTDAVLPEYIIENCTFRNGESRGKGGTLFANNIKSLIICNCLFDNCKGDGLIAYADTGVQRFEFDSNEIINMNDIEHYLVVSWATEFNLTQNKISGNMKGFKLSKGELVYIENIDIPVNLLIESEVSNAEIRNCNFINPIINDFAIYIRNNCCLFFNNTVIFDENLYEKGKAICISGQGNIQVMHNKFINCSPSTSGSSIYYSPGKESIPGTVYFNYNLIKGISSGKFALFSINYINENFNFDHNIISECINENTKNEGYMSQISGIKTKFIIINLTFINCISGAEYGGGFGCWFTSSDSNYDDKLISFINCSFINNTNIDDRMHIGGGAFQIGYTTNSYFKIYLEGCNFSNNTAWRGGSLSLGGHNFKIHNGPITIYDCKFCNNKASNDIGGAILIVNDDLEKILIENCVFENNIDYGGKGNAIYIENSIRYDSENLVQITNCNFHNNFDDKNELNYAIYSSSPSFSISESFITADEISSKISGINFGELYSKNSIINLIFEKCNSKNSNENKLGNAININCEQTTILNTKFIDCGEEGKGNVIDFSGTKITFSNNIIEFSQENSGSRGIEFKTCSEIEFINNTFIRCHSGESGGGILFYINIIDATESFYTFENLSILFCCAKSGSGIQINEENHKNEFEIKNCTFKNNKSYWHGGSCLFENVNKININNCFFDGNIANKKYSSSNLFSEKTEGLGGAIFITSSYDTEKTNENQFIIENCAFINNIGYDGNSIYIEGYGYGNEFIIRHNKFTNNFRTEDENNDPYFLYRGVITSEVFNLYEGKILKENDINNYDSIQTVKLSYVNHDDIPILPTKSSHFTHSDFFSDSNQFSPSNVPTMSPLQTTVFVRTKRIVYSNSFSLTYVFIKSISYSISFFVSNTISISYNEEEKTYVAISSEGNFYGYFPYIIRSLSPSYVQTYISINKSIRKSISQEQLIGITCGSASVFFLVLGIIILVIRRREENKLIYDEFDDLSYSFDEAVEQNAKEENNIHDQNEQNDINENNESGSYSEICV